MVGDKTNLPLILGRPMEITIEDISPVEKKLQVEVPWGDVSPRLDKAYGKLKRRARIKGFRPGKVPRSVLEQVYRAEVENEVAREVIEASLAQAVEDKQFEPVAPPTVDDFALNKGQVFTFSARIEVRSEVENVDFDGIELTRRVGIVRRRRRQRP